MCSNQTNWLLLSCCYAAVYKFSKFLAKSYSEPFKPWILIFQLFTKCYILIIIALISTTIFNQFTSFLLGRLGNTKTIWIFLQSLLDWRQQFNLFGLCKIIGYLKLLFYILTLYILIKSDTISINDSLTFFIQYYWLKTILCNIID